jgi:hypothetical protein
MAQCDGCSKFFPLLRKDGTQVANFPLQESNEDYHRSPVRGDKCHLCSTCRDERHPYTDTYTFHEVTAEHMHEEAKRCFLTMIDMYGTDKICSNLDVSATTKPEEIFPRFLAKVHEDFYASVQ